jgi:mRNA interferase RelE/StbE
MQPKAAQQIRVRILAVAQDPSSPSLDVKPLTNRPGFRLRVGDWRIIFDMDATTLEVLAIETRGDVYKPRKRS